MGRNMWGENTTRLDMSGKGGLALRDTSYGVCITAALDVVEEK